MKKSLFLFVLTLLLFTKANASHFAGGDIRYEFNGTNYTVHVMLYKLCESGGIPLSSTVDVCWNSLTATYSGSRTFNLVNFDTISINCPGTLSNCYNITNPIQGYIAAYYKDTVSLPFTGEWRLSCINSARIGSTTNIAGGSMYLEAILDNRITHNSNPLIAGIPNYYMTAGNAISVPLQAADPEGDSLDFQFIQPLDGNICGPGTPLTYNSGGFSLTTPFGTGGTCTINPATKMLTMMAPSAGNYALAFRVTEYRNGIKVGEFIRDMMVVVMSGTSALTFPNANLGTTFNMYTCPGQSNSITLNFYDPTSTDSVYLSVMPPTIPGFTFTSTTSNALASASTTISWTTPGSMNPATLPQFFIRIRARDNACPNASVDFALAVRTRQCLADTVWPGDANGDFTVNVYDPLALFIAFGQTGAARISPTNAWIPQYCAPWANSFVTNNTNMKHADCDGNGTVGISDTTAIGANYGLWHLKGGNSAHKTTAGAPDLYFDLSTTSYAAGATAYVPIKLGSSTASMNDVYGLATKITIDGVTLDNPPTISTAGSWLGTSALSFEKATSNNSIDWAHGRTNHSNISGQGTIGTLIFTIPANTPVGTKITLDFDDNITRIIDYKGLPLAGYNLNKGEASVEHESGVAGFNNTSFSAFIVPNPSSSGAGVQLTSDKTANVFVEVTDVMGRKLWNKTSRITKGTHTIVLPDELSAGIYLVRISNDDTKDAQPVKWVKQ